MEKKRQREIGDAAILEVLRLARMYPNMEKKDIVTMVIGKGLAETMSPSTVWTIIKCGSLEAYTELKRQKREDFRTRKQQAETTAGAQTKLSLPEEPTPDRAERPERSAAAAEMIGNQKRILEGQVKMITNQDEIRDWLVGVTVRLENIGLLLNAMLNVWTGDPIGIRERLDRLREQ